MYHCGADLAVAGSIRDNEQNVLQSTFQTTRSDTPSYFLMFFLIAFFEIFIKNTIITLKINYNIIIMCTNNNVKIIILEFSKTLFFY
jgi:hypothetical protein